MRFELHKDHADEWRWRLRTTNGNVVADSGEGYRHRDDCERGIAIVKGSAEAPVVDLSAKIAATPDPARVTGPAVTDHTPRIGRAAFKRLAPAFGTAMAAIDAAAVEAGLDEGLLELVKLRASQMNGCAFCVQHHLTAARTLRVSREKLDLLIAWQDAPTFTDRERAALAWTEAVTDVGLGISEDDYDDAREQFSEAQIAHLSAAIAAINAWNRISVGFRFAPEPPGPRAVEL